MVIKLYSNCENWSEAVVSQVTTSRNSHVIINTCSYICKSSCEQHHFCQKQPCYIVLLNMQKNPELKKNFNIYWTNTEFFTQMGINSWLIQKEYIFRINKMLFSGLITRVPFKFSLCGSVSLSLLAPQKCINIASLLWIQLGYSCGIYQNSQKNHMNFHFPVCILVEIDKCFLKME